MIFYFIYYDESLIGLLLLCTWAQSMSRALVDKKIECLWLVRLMISTIGQLGVMSVLIIDIMR